MGTSPDFLVLGHVTLDLQPDGSFRPGGTALYAALTAARLGYRAALYTAASPAEADEWLVSLRRAGVEVVCRPSPATTTFQNRYRAGRRRQYLFRRAEPLPPEELPAGWEEVPLVLLGPVAGEVSPTWAERFPRSLVGACLQGWLRDWGRSGQVRFVPWNEAERYLPSLGAAFLSEEDVRPRPALV
ncbi:MAG: ribokinase, partial [Chloroflexia bacterium]